MRRLFTILPFAFAVWGSIAPGSSASDGQQPSLAAVARRVPDYRTEQEWLIQEVLGTMAFQGWAVHGGPPTAVHVTVHTRPATAEALLDRAVLDVSVGDTRAVLDVSSHTWDPAVYVPVARALLGPAPPALSKAGASERSLAADLTDFRIQTLLAADDRVSTALARNRFSRASQEDAALLIGALAWRERANKYSDVRRLLSRMTAHLAVAAAVQPNRPASESGRLAALIISVLAGREDLFSAGLALWPEATRTPAARAWIRALTLRVIGDWRGVTVTSATSLLERLEYARTLRDRVSESRLLDFYDEQVTEDPDTGDRRADEVTDWQRIALGNVWTGAGIEVGHRFAVDAADHEMTEATVAWRHYHGRESTTALVIAALNDDPREDGRVLGWPVWSAALQRHLAAALVSAARFLAGIDDKPAMAAWPSTVEAPYGSLLLFPYVLRDAASDASQYVHAMELARRAQLAHPELVTAAISATLRHLPRFEAPPTPGPNDTTWLTPHEPTGTGFDLEWRTLSEGCPRPVPLVHVERWAARAPHNAYVQDALIWLPAPGEPAFAAVQQQLAPLLEYDLHAASLLIDHLHGTPDQVIPVARKMCQLDKDSCSRLVDDLLADGQEEEAATAGDAYALGARDTVGLSHYTDWLVKYLWDTNRRERAAAIAMHVGATHSAPGLRTLGYLMEQREQWDSAEAVYREIADHYEEEAPLTAYYLRRATATHDDQWVRRAEQSGKKLFPGGFEHGDPAWLPAPPKDGVEIVACGRRCGRLGLMTGDIVTAVDGRRVRSVEQYSVMSRVSFDPQMHLVVWRGAKYVTLDLTVPQRWFGSENASHRAGATHTN